MISARWLMIPFVPLAGSLRGAAPPPAKPDILLIVGDDIGWGDIGCYGSTQIQTPNIGRLAKEGIRFASGYVTASLCNPSPAAMLTGQDQLNKAWDDWNATLPPAFVPTRSQPPVVTPGARSSQGRRPHRMRHSHQGQTNKKICLLNIGISRQQVETRQRLTCVNLSNPSRPSKPNHAFRRPAGVMAG